MGDRGFADAHEGGDVADAQLAGGERIEDADACRIAEHAKRVGNRVNRAVRHQRRPPCRRATFVEMSRGVALRALVYDPLYSGPPCGAGFTNTG